MEPPRLAKALLKLTTDPVDRTPLIGDLNEEFLQLQKVSPDSANSWYWRQMILSMPALILKRLRQKHVSQLILLFSVTIGAYIAIAVWDAFIARSFVQMIAGTFSALPVVVIRGVYILAQMIGIAIAGGALARLTFRSSDSFVHNIKHRLAPLAVILFIPPVAITLLTDNGYPLGFRLAWLSVSAPSLLIGALYGFRTLSQRRK